MSRRRRGGRSRALATVLSVLVLGPALHAAPTLAAPGGVGPSFGDKGVVTTDVRPSSDDFSTAMAVQDDQHVVMAAGAGGDFGLARFDRHLHPTQPLGPADNRVTTDFGGTADVPRAVAVTGSGLVVAAGSAGGDLAVARYDDAGVLDRSLDGDGRLTVDLGGTDDAAYALTPLPDGRLLVAGGRAASVTVLRLLPDGRPDPTFGTGGRVTLASSGPGRAAAMQPDGKLLVAGGGDALVVHRLLGDGSLDAAFAAAGKATVNLGAPATAHAMVLAPDGNIVLAGARGNDVVVARLTGAGQRDATFGALGVTTSGFGVKAAAYALARRADGALLVAGDLGDRALTVRYRPDGSLETGFGTGGHAVTERNPVDGTLVTRFRAAAAHPENGWIVVGARGSDAYVGRLYEPHGFSAGPMVDFGSPRQQVTGATVQSDGKVVAVAEAGGDIALVRYHPDGTRDGAFGVGGIVASDRGTLPRAVAVQPGGRIVVAASTARAPMRAALVGFRPDGSLDTGFGDDGRAEVDLTGDTQIASRLAALPDGRLLLSGGSTAGSSLVRFTVDGRLDATFGSGGRALGAFPGYAAAEGDLAVQADGRILALGSDEALYRFQADGSRDPTFGGGDGKLTFDAVDLRYPAALAARPDGRILVGGRRSSYFGDLTVVRLLPDGSTDPSWTIAPAEFKDYYGYPRASRPSALAVMPDGRVVAAGTSTNELAFVRLQPDGALDKTFGGDGLLHVDEPMSALPVIVVPTAAAGLLTVATAWSASGFYVARVATGQLGAPTAVTAVAASGAARVRWARPPLIDESPIVAYRVTASDGVHTATTTDAAHFSAIVRGLTPGRAYTFTVQAVRRGGDGPRSAPSNAMSPGMSAPTSAWGWNGATQLGDGTATDRLAPVNTAGITGAVALAGGAFHSVALRADGTVWAWGWNGTGQVGDGSNGIRPSAVQVPGMTNVVSVAAGALHSMALKADGTVWAWGWNGLGQLGNGSLSTSLLPVRVGGLSGIKAIGAGLHHSLAVRSDGTVVAWGWNATGQLGDGSAVDRTLPTPVRGVAGITAVAAGALHSLALTDAGTVWVWGWNGYGQFGSSDTDDHPSPFSPSLTGIVSIAAGAYHSYALQDDGDVQAWGSNEHGQLGNPQENPSNGILNVWNLQDVAFLASGWFHGLAVRHDGSTVAWGANTFGQLGDGTTTSRNTVAPVRVPSPVAVGAGAYHSLSA